MGPDHTAAAPSAPVVPGGTRSSARLPFTTIGPGHDSLAPIFQTHLAGPSGAYVAETPLACRDHPAWAR
jgi:hypothetical protein